MSSNFGQIRLLTMELAALERQIKVPYTYNGKMLSPCNLFIFDQILIRVARNQDRHKRSDEFDFGPDQTTHFGVTCP